MEQTYHTQICKKCGLFFLNLTWLPETISSRSTSTGFFLVCSLATFFQRTKNNSCFGRGGRRACSVPQRQLYHYRKCWGRGNSYSGAHNPCCCVGMFSQHHLDLSQILNTHLTDYAAGAAFFGDKYRLHQDALADGVCSIFSFLLISVFYLLAFFFCQARKWLDQKFGPLPSPSEPTPCETPAVSPWVLVCVSASTFFLGVAVAYLVFKKRASSGLQDRMLSDYKSDY